MRIAICDDDSLDLLYISKLLEKYHQKTNADFTCKMFLNATELLYSMETSFYDLLFLDIFMGGFNGIEAAREIRLFNPSVKIIFLTSSPEFALQSYGVKAFDYIIKPILKEKLYSTLDELFSQEQKTFDGFSIKTPGGFIRVLFSDLVFIEVASKRLYFHLSDSTVREVISPLSKYEERLLSRGEFIKIHRSYIINMSSMAELTKNEFITQNGDSLSISRLLYAKVRKSYMEYLFIEESI